MQNYGDGVKLIIINNKIEKRLKIRQVKIRIITIKLTRLIIKILMRKINKNKN